MIIGNGSSSYDMTGFTLFWGCEAADFSGTNGSTDYSAGDDTFTLQSSAAINSDAGMYGTNGLDFPTSADYGTFNPASMIPVDTDFIVALAINFHTAWPSALVRIWRLRDTVDGDSIAIYTDASGNLKIDYTDAGVLQGNASVTGLSTATVYFVLAIVDKTNDDIYLKVYNSSKSLVTSDSDLNIGLGTTENWNSLRIGSDTGNTSDFYLDQIRINEDLNDEDDVLQTMDCTDYSGC